MVMQRPCIYDSFESVIDLNAYLLASCCLLIFILATIAAQISSVEVTIVC